MGWIRSLYKDDDDDDDSDNDNDMIRERSDK